MVRQVGAVAPFGWAMVAGFGSLIVVSLLTPPDAPERIKRFFDQMNRSSDEPAGEEPTKLNFTTAGIATPRPR